MRIIFKENLMCRSICALGLVLAAYTLPATPAPAPEPFKSGWNRPVDPDRDCKFVFRGGTVTIELPGSDHDLAPKRGLFNAPRILRDVKGDFLMEVRVSGSFRPSVKSSAKGEKPSVAAGLVMINDEKECIRLEYGVYRQKEEQYKSPAFRMEADRDIAFCMHWPVPWEKDVQARNEEHIYLRLDRRGRFIYQALSPDGKNWTYQARIDDPKMSAKLKIGLAAYSTSAEPFKPCFDRFKLHLGRAKYDVSNVHMTYGSKE
jgi:hypothetical protein